MTAGNDIPGFASPPCYRHELDPDCPENAGGSSDWEVIRSWRVRTRSELRAYRDGLGQAERTQIATAIGRQLRDSELLAAHDRIGFYWPMPGEIDLRPLLAELVASGVTAALPVISAAGQPLQFCRWAPGDELSEDGVWGIPAPMEKRAVDVSALLIPTLGFDDAGHRLGHGGGYYDRTLASMAPRPVAIGIAYEASRLRSIYPQAHDVPMDVVVTEVASRTFPAGRG